MCGLQITDPQTDRVMTACLYPVCGWSVCLRSKGNLVLVLVVDGLMDFCESLCPYSKKEERVGNTKQSSGAPVIGLSGVV